MKPIKRITVLLAEDHGIVREGLRGLLEAHDDIEVVGESATGRQAVEMTRKLNPAVIVMDIAMPRLNGLEAARQIRQTVPAVKVLILSAHNDDTYVEKAMEMGVAGYLIKQTSADFLAKAIREVEKGNTYFSSAIVKKCSHYDQQASKRKQPPKTKIASLSPREMEVLQLIAEGEANKQIAAELGVSIKTVEKHRDHLMHKLDIHDTASLTRYAISAGVIENSVQLTVG
ncbi:MAG: response regulator transcription factor [Magnetococcus sp. WYHC-3]